MGSWIVLLGASLSSRSFDAVEEGCSCPVSVPSSMSVFLAADLLSNPRGLGSSYEKNGLLSKALLLLLLLSSELSGPGFQSKHLRQTPPMVGGPT